MSAIKRGRPAPNHASQSALVRAKRELLLEAALTYGRLAPTLASQPTVARHELEQAAIAFAKLVGGDP